MTVLNGDGLVGRVTTVGPNTSTVLLASDPDFTVGTRMEKSDELGFATGQGDRADAGRSCSTARPRCRRATGWSPSARRPTSRSCPASRSATSCGVDPSGGDLTRTIEVTPFVGFTQLDVVGVVVAGARARTRATPCCPPKPKPTPDADRHGRPSHPAAAAAGRNQHEQQELNPCA